jgi:hypothetical protein
MSVSGAFNPPLLTVMPVSKSGPWSVVPPSATR